MPLIISGFTVTHSDTSGGRLSACVLGTYPDRQLAWQAVGTLGLDGTLTNGLVLAITRCVTVFFISKSVILNVVQHISDYSRHFLLKRNGKVTP